MLLGALKSFNPDADLETLIELSAIAGILRTEFENNGLDVPDELNTKAKAIKRAIALKAQEHLEARRNELKARLSALATPEEKRQALRDELAKLENVGK